VKHVLARAPSNIALVKYMGKSSRPEHAGKNIPRNASLSMTLSNLCSFVELRTAAEKGVVWKSEAPEGARGEAPRLDENGAAKFLRHFERCRLAAPEIAEKLGLALDSESATVPGVEIRSANTFPHAAGIASSASSFAALTLASFAFFSREPEMFRTRYRAEPGFRRALAALSREGSGSSCRSFEGPFVSWREDQTSTVPSKLPPLSDLVVVVSAGEKKVGSSEAHRRVLESQYWTGRPERANRRESELAHAIGQGDFATLSAIAEADFRDMHQLFETSNPPFSYFVDGTERVLEFLENEDADSFAVTMDAGPNVHVIVPQSGEEHWKKKLADAFPEYPILVDREGAGAEIVVLETNSEGSTA
jgi:diphosphomevalonate decarboxylase